MTDDIMPLAELLQKGRRRQFPPRCRGERSAYADGDRSRRPDRHEPSRAQRRAAHLKPQQKLHQVDGRDLYFA
jgi:hypothetical protein